MLYELDGSLSTASAAVKALLLDAVRAERGYQHKILPSGRLYSRPETHYLLIKLGGRRKGSGCSDRGFEVGRSFGQRPVSNPVRRQSKQTRINSSREVANSVPQCLQRMGSIGQAKKSIANLDAREAHPLVSILAAKR